LLLAVVTQGAVARAVRYALETSGSRGLEYLNPDALHVSTASLAVGAGLALVIGVLAGLLPLRVFARPDLSANLRGASAGGFQRRRAGGETARGLLVSAQLAFTLVLLAGTGLIGSSLAKLSEVETGLDNKDVLALRFDAGPGREELEARAFEREVLERIAALPGVAAAATAPCPPLSGACEVTGIRQIDDDPPVDFGYMEGILTYEVSADYFRALGVSVLEGRVLDGDIAGPEDPPLAVVSASAAEKHFGGSALGHRLSVTHELTEEMQAEIVGVVEDVRYGSLEEEVMPAVYFSRAQATPPYGTILVHTSGDPGALLEEVRAAVRTVDPSLALTDVTTLSALKAVATARTRVLLWLLLAFSAVGLLLSAVGIYGVVSYDVQRRTRETGLRLALGAPAADVLRSTLARPAIFAGVGSVLGVAGALLLTRQLRALLFQVQAGDPRVLAASAVVLLGVAVAAAWAPTRRALRVDPAQTLRGE
jgi:predicted permease